MKPNPNEALEQLALLVKAEPEGHPDGEEHEDKEREEMRKEMKERKEMREEKERKEMHGEESPEKEEMRKHFKKFMKDHRDEAEGYMKEAGYLKKGIDTHGAQSVPAGTVEEQTVTVIEGTGMFKACMSAIDSLVKAMNSQQKQIDAIGAGIEYSETLLKAIGRVTHENSQQLLAAGSEIQPVRGAGSSGRQVVQSDLSPAGIIPEEVLGKAQSLGSRNVKAILEKAARDADDRMKDRIMNAAMVFDMCGGNLSRVQPHHQKVISQVLAAHQ